MKNQFLTFNHSNKWSFSNQNLNFQLIFKNFWSFGSFSEKSLRRVKTSSWKISSRSQNQIHTVLSFFSIRFLVYWISLPQKRVYWWTVLGSVKFYLQICLQFLFWCQIRGHIKSARSLLFFSPSDCSDCSEYVRLLGTCSCFICSLFNCESGIGVLF